MIFAHFSPLPGHFPRPSAAQRLQLHGRRRRRRGGSHGAERLQGHLQLAVQVLDGATGGQKSTYFSWETLGI